MARYDVQKQSTVSLLYSATTGDVTALRRFHAQGYNMATADYDKRTALHLVSKLILSIWRLRLTLILLQFLTYVKCFCLITQTPRLRQRGIWSVSGSWWRHAG